MKRYTVEQIERGMRGHWEELLMREGWDRSVFRGKHCPCPICGGRDRFRWGGRKKGRDYGESGGALCTQCGSHNGLWWYMTTRGIHFSDVLIEIGRDFLRIEPDEVDFVPVEKPQFTAPRLNPQGQDATARYIRRIESTPGYDEEFFRIAAIIAEALAAQAAQENGDYSDALDFLPSTAWDGLIDDEAKIPEHLIRVEQPEFI